MYESKTNHFELRWQHALRNVLIFPLHLLNWPYIASTPNDHWLLFHHTCILWDLNVDSHSSWFQSLRTSNTLKWNAHLENRFFHRLDKKKRWETMCATFKVWTLACTMELVINVIENTVNRFIFIVSETMHLI